MLHAEYTASTPAGFDSIMLRAAAAAAGAGKLVGNEKENMAPNTGTY